MHQFSSRCASSCGDRQSRMPKIMESKIRTVGKRSCSFPTALQRVSGQWLSVSTREKERVWVDLATRQSIGFATAAEPVDDALAFVGQVVRLFDGAGNGELPERCGRAAGWQYRRRENTPSEQDAPCADGHYPPPADARVPVRHVAHSFPFGDNVWPGKLASVHPSRQRSDTSPSWNRSEQLFWRRGLPQPWRSLGDGRAAPRLLVVLPLRG